MKFNVFVQVLFKEHYFVSHEEAVLRGEKNGNKVCDWLSVKRMSISFKPNTQNSNSEL